MEYEKVDLNPGELKGQLENLWFEGIEDLFNKGLINSEADLKKYYHKATRKDFTRHENNWSEKKFKDVMGKVFSAREPGLLNKAGQQLKRAGKYAQEKFNEATTEGTALNKALVGEDAKHLFDVFTLNKNQRDYLERMGANVEPSLNKFMSELHQPIQQPQNQLNTNVGSALNTLIGPSLNTLLSQPNPNMFQGQFASQLPYQQGPSSGISSLIGTLGAPLLQQLLSGGK